MRPLRLLLSHRIIRALVCVLGLIVIASRPAATATPSSPAAAGAVVALARSLIGAPYAYIGDDPRTGFSCIGFVHYLYAQVGIDVPYNLDLAYAAWPRVAAADLQPGDLVFFSNTVWNGLSHVALYVGDRAIIGADNFATGVELTYLSNPYWVAHYTGATRPPGYDAVAVPPASPRPRSSRPSPLPTAGAHAGQLLTGRMAGEVYSGPGYAYQRIDRLAPRTSLRVVGIQGRWANVAYHGPGSDYYGWVDGTYLAACTILTPPAPHNGRHHGERRVGALSGWW